MSGPGRRFMISTAHVLQTGRKITGMTDPLQVCSNQTYRIIPSAQGIYQPHLFNSIAAYFQQPGIGNEYGRASGPGQGHIEPFPAEQKILMPGQVFLAGAGSSACFRVPQ